MCAGCSKQERRLAYGVVAALSLHYPRFLPGTRARVGSATRSTRGGSELRMLILSYESCDAFHFLACFYFLFFLLPSSYCCYPIAFCCSHLSEIVCLTRCLRRLRRLRPSTSSRTLLRRAPAPLQHKHKHRLHLHRLRSQFLLSRLSHPPRHLIPSTKRPPL